MHSDSASLPAVDQMYIICLNNKFKVTTVDGFEFGGFVMNNTIKK